MLLCFSRNTNWKKEGSVLYFFCTSCLCWKNNSVSVVMQMDLFTGSLKAICYIQKMFKHSSLRVPVSSYKYMNELLFLSCSAWLSWYVKVVCCREHKHRKESAHTLPISIFQIELSQKSASVHGIYWKEAIAAMGPATFSPPHNLRASDCYCKCIHLPWTILSS